MKILGISAFHRDAAAALVVDGKVVAAAQEERFTRKKADSGFPRRSARWCLTQGGLPASDLDAVVFNEKPLRKFERMIVTQLRAFPRSAQSFSRGMFLWLGDRLWMRNRIADEMGVEPESVRFVEHHRAHAACAYMTSPFDEAAVLIVDDTGEWTTTSLSVGREGQLELLAEIAFPDSLGLFVSAITQFLGFEPGQEEELVEALSAHGEPRFRAELQQLVIGTEQGGFKIDPTYFRFAFDGEHLFAPALAELLGPPREAGSPLRMSGDDRRDAEVAASLQVVVEERVLELARELHRRVPETKALCFGGSLALNRRLNARLLDDGPFEELHVPAAPDEAGTALGAALLYHCTQVEGAVVRAGSPFLGELPVPPTEPKEELADEPALIAALARRLAAGECLALARGKMEYANRSLGHRSLLAGALRDGARERLLGTVRRDESYRPCRLLIPADRCEEFVELPKGASSPLRLGWLALPARELLRQRVPDAVAPDGRVWIQAVDAALDSFLARVLESYEAEAGLPLVFHASLALRGAPIARTTDDALDVFQRSGLDALFVDRALFVPD